MSTKQTPAEEPAEQEVDLLNGEVGGSQHSVAKRLNGEHS